MAITPLRNVTLIGRVAEKESVLTGVQKLACVHLIDAAGATSSSFGEHPIHSDLFAAIKYLQKCPVQRPSASDLSEYDARRIAAEVLANRDRKRQLHERVESLTDAIAQTEPWGEFRRPDQTELGGQQLWFYRVRHRELDKLPGDMVTTVVSNDREFTYVVVVAPEPPGTMPGTQVQLDGRPLSELREQLAHVKQDIEANEVERIALTRWLPALERDLLEAELEIERAQASEKLLGDEALFALQGWVPLNLVGSLKQYAQQHGLAIIIREPQRDEEPPTLLKNPAPVSGAEDAVTFFMTPRYRSWDPTWVMYVSFSVFFAMIIADAGYGLVLAVILALLIKKLGRSESGRRFRNLAVSMVAVTVVYGVLIGSYFGIAPPQGSFLDRFVVKSAGESIVNNREAMMFVSATIGVIHLMLANIIVAIGRIGRSSAFSSIGWAAAMAGGWMMAVASVSEPPITASLAATVQADPANFADGFWIVGQTMLIGGLVLVLLFTSERPLFSNQPKDWLMRPVDGLMGLTNVTKAFGDALSYLRLFALGLASGQLAIIFNQLASDVSQVRGVGLLLGLLVFLFGHGLNLVLAIVGGVVHGLRLNCIEFFSWSLNEEGRPFQAFGKRLASDE